MKEDKFSSALVRDVADALYGHGFPEIEEASPDWYALTWVLVRFCHGEPGKAGCVRDGGVRR